jgi:hypothetical protein
MAREELQVWLLAESPDGRWSEAVYVENEECGMRNEELMGDTEYSSATAERRSTSPNVGEEHGVAGAFFRPPDNIS